MNFVDIDYLAPSAMLCRQIIMHERRPMTRKQIIDFVRKNCPHHFRRTVERRVCCTITSAKNGRLGRDFRLMSYNCQDVFYGLYEWLEDRYADTLIGD